MGEVIGFSGTTIQDSDPDEILKAWIGELEAVVVIGIDKDQQEILAASTSDVPLIIFLAERLKLKLLSELDAEESS